MKRGICREIREMAEDYHQNSLEPGSALRVKAHLSECASCRNAYEKTREIVTLFKNDRLPDPGPLFWNHLNSRIMTQVRLSRPEEKEIPWYKKVWGNPFGWPGYAWATALILILLTPVVIYNIQVQSHKTSSVLEKEVQGQEIRWDTASLPFYALFESLSERESAHLAKRMAARMGKDLPGPSPWLMEDDLQWDISRSLEGLNKQELDALIKKMEPGGSAGYKEEEKNVC